MAELSTTPTQTITSPTDSGESNVNFLDLLRKCLARWHWFVFAVAVALVLSFLYVKSKTPVYTRNAIVQIKNDRNSGNSVSNLSQSFSDMGLIAGSSNVYNEMAVFHSFDATSRFTHSVSRAM